MDKFKKFLSEMSSPPLHSRKKRLAYFFWSLPLDFLIFRFYFKIPLLFCLLLTIVFIVIILLSFLWESKSEKKDEALKESLESGDYRSSGEWREKYEQYTRKHDFITVKARTMKSDLNRIYLKPSGIIITVFAVIFTVFSLVWESGDPALNTFLAVCGFLFLAYGLAKLLKTPVRPFLKNCGDELSYIERSYLNGRMLKFRCNGELAENSGINIGGNYIVMYNSKNILAIDKSRIIKAEKLVEQTKCYINSVYSGSYKLYFISITYRNKLNKNCNFKVRLNEFQIEMAYEVISATGNNAAYTQKIRHDVGT